MSLSQDIFLILSGRLKVLVKTGNILFLMVLFTIKYFYLVQLGYIVVDIGTVSVALEKKC